MQKLPATALPLLLLPILLASISTTTNAHNITRILAQHPEFSTFSHYLSTTHLAEEINRRRTITVCAVDNAAMADLLSKHLSLPSLKNVLSLHVFADYFGTKRLHEINKRSTTTSTLFQATGEAAGTAGYVNITDTKGGKVQFAVADYEGEYGPFISSFVKSVDEISYDLAVIQISHILTSPDAEAPVGAPTDLNVTNLMQRQGCKAFSDLLKSSGAEEVFTQNAAGGITVFCPTDGAINGFMPKYNNLTKDQKTTLLLFHGIPFYNSLGMLKSKNGVLNTLATEGKKKFNVTVKQVGEDVTVDTRVNVATVDGTLIDQDPLAVFKVDHVLRPPQLFKADAPAPKPSKGGGSSADATADSPGPAGNDDVPADETASNNGSIRVGGGWTTAAVLSLVLGYCMVLV